MNYVAQFKLKLMNDIIEEELQMKGYYTGYSYYGWMPSENDYIKFVSDSEYAEAYREEQENE